MATTIDTVPSFPQAPQRTDTPENFVTLADAWVAFMDTFTDSLNVSIGQMNTAADEVEVSAANALVSENNAAGSASAADSSANATAFVSGVAVTKNDNIISQIDFLTYRVNKDLSGGANTTDPLNAPDDYEQISNSVEQQHATALLF